MNDRIKIIRKHFKLSQEDFGNRIGISRSSVCKLETGENNPSERTLILICKEFAINEVWLRTGEGGEENMFTKVSEDDAYSLALGKLTTEENRFVKSAVKYLANTEPEKLKIIEEFMKSCLGIE